MHAKEVVGLEHWPRDEQLGQADLFSLKQKWLRAGMDLTEALSITEEIAQGRRMRDNWHKLKDRSETICCV